jgi:glutathione peroxidase
MFAKVKVNGKDACGLYRFLTKQDAKPKGAGRIGWNFEKFILDRKGVVVARFGARTKPDAPEIVSVIERELANTPSSTAGNSVSSRTGRQDA